MRASYSFLAENPNELSLNKGDMITVLEEVDPGWWIGECKGIQGLFPAKSVLYLFKKMYPVFV